MKRPLIALATALLGSAAAVAAPVTMHNFEYGYENLHSAQFGSLGTGALMGEYNGGASNSFITFCNDLYQHFSWNVTYTDYTLVANGAPNGLTISQADMLGKLYTTAGAIDNHDKSVAFQLAVWELTHDATPGDIFAGAFSIDSGGTTAQLDLTQSWLHYATDANSANSYVVTRLYSPTAQDFLVAHRNDVPEPTAAWLVGLALAALALKTRRSA